MRRVFVEARRISPKQAISVLQLGSDELIKVDRLTHQADCKERPSFKFRINNRRAVDQGTPDEHAALLVELADFAPLVCAVHSGGKSLHGWFAVRGQPEEKVRRFFSYAVMLGADPATWTRSQFVRMPGGRRDNGNLQAVCYCNPAGLKNV